MGSPNVSLLDTQVEFDKSGDLTNLTQVDNALKDSSRPDTRPTAA